MSILSKRHEIGCKGTAFFWNDQIFLTKNDEKGAFCLHFCIFPADSAPIGYYFGVRHPICSRFPPTASWRPFLQRSEDHQRGNGHSGLIVCAQYVPVCFSWHFCLLCVVGNQGTVRAEKTCRPRLVPQKPEAKRVSERHFFDKKFIR